MRRFAREPGPSPSPREAGSFPVTADRSPAPGRRLPPPFAFSAGFKIDTRHSGHHCRPAIPRRDVKTDWTPEHALAHTGLPRTDRGSGDGGARREPTVARPRATTFVHLRARFYLSRSLARTFRMSEGSEDRGAERRAPADSFSPPRRSLAVPDALRLKLNRAGRPYHDPPPRTDNRLPSYCAAPRRAAPPSPRRAASRRASPGERPRAVGKQNVSPAGDSRRQDR